MKCSLQFLHGLAVQKSKSIILLVDNSAPWQKIHVATMFVNK